MKIRQWTARFAIAALGAALVACNGDEHDHDGSMHDGHGHDGHMEQAPADGESAGLQGLAPEDRAAAETQGTCPVSGQPLGSMGKPIRMEHEGRTVFLCCRSCVSKFEAEPQKYLAKLDE